MCADERMKAGQAGIYRVDGYLAVTNGRMGRQTDGQTTNHLNLTCRQA